MRISNASTQSIPATDAGNKPEADHPTPKTLTRADVATLTARFQPEDHEVKPGFSSGKSQKKQLFLPYVGEEEINLRLSEVDPGWTFTIDHVEARENHYAVYATLTVCGVSRQGVGTGKHFKDDEIAEKGATTDALKRTARLFGIGAYLKRSTSLWVDSSQPQWKQEQAAMAKLRQWLTSGDNATPSSSSGNGDNGRKPDKQPAATLGTIDDADQAFAAPFFKDGAFDGSRLYKAAAKQGLLDELKDRLQEACGTLDMRQIHPPNAIAAWKFVLDEQGADEPADINATPSPDATPPPELETPADESEGDAQGKA